MKLQGFYNYTAKEKAIKDLEQEQKNKDSLKVWYEIERELNIMGFGE